MFEKLTDERIQYSFPCLFIREELYGLLYSILRITIYKKYAMSTHLMSFSKTYICLN